jgi:hypothetical protein
MNDHGIKYETCDNVDWIKAIQVKSLAVNARVGINSCNKAINVGLVFVLEDLGCVFRIIGYRRQRDLMYGSSALAPVNHFGGHANSSLK